MMTDKEIKKFFKLLDIEINESNDTTVYPPRYLDKFPLDITYQNTTPISTDS